jgi:acyl carrier protein
MRQAALKIVNCAVAEINETLDEKVDLALGEEAPVYGRDGALDSLSLVSLILLIEEQVELEFGKTISITDDRAMSQFRSPFRTVGSIADFVTALAA